MAELLELFPLRDTEREADLTTRYRIFHSWYSRIRVTTPMAVQSSGSAAMTHAKGFSKVRPRTTNPYKPPTAAPAPTTVTVELNLESYLFQMRRIVSTFYGMAQLLARTAYRSLPVSGSAQVGQSSNRE